MVRKCSNKMTEKRSTGRQCVSHFNISNPTDRKMRRKNDKMTLSNLNKNGVAFDIQKFHLFHSQDCHLS